MAIVKKKIEKEVELEVIAHIKEEELPFCCGVIVFGEADYEGSNDGDSIEEDEMPDGAKTEALKEALQHKYACGLGAGLYLYTTIEEQKPEIDALRESGYTSLTQFVNPGTLNTVTLWGKMSNQPAPRRRRR